MKEHRQSIKSKISVKEKSQRKKSHEKSKPIPRSRKGSPCCDHGGPEEGQVFLFRGQQERGDNVGHFEL